MGQCKKCTAMLPPDFLIDMSPTEKLCIFCERDITEIVYGEHKEKKATKQEIIEEYKKFLKMILVKNDILKNAVKEKGVVDIPEKIRP